MTEDQNQVGSAQVELRGAFVETALTNDQVVLAIAEEKRLGIRDGECVFLEHPLARVQAQPKNL